MSVYGSSYKNIIKESVREILEEEGIIEEAFIPAEERSMLDEYTIQIVDEAAAEAGAESLKHVMKWYDKILDRSLDKADRADQIKMRIKVLKEAVRDMEKAKENKHGERVKYALKSLIPFNSLYRLIKSQDVYAGISGLSGLAAHLVIGGTITADAVNAYIDNCMHNPMNNERDIERAKNDLIDSAEETIVGNTLGGGIGRGTSFAIRLATFRKMLDAQIAKTKKAIVFLEDRLEELNKRK